MHADASPDRQAADRVGDPATSGHAHAGSRRAARLLAAGLALMLAAPARAQLSGEAASEAAAFEPVIEFEIFPDDLADGDDLGACIDVQGGMAVLGTPCSDHVATDGGVTYIYRLVAGSWQPEAQLAPADLGANDQFGYSCSLDGDVLAVGAPWHGGLGPEVGTVYVYRRAGGAWTLEQKLFPSTPLDAGHFGTDVAVSGDLVAVGRYHQAAGMPGRVHLFRHDGSSWVEEDSVTAADAELDDLYAYALDVDGDHLAVGSYRDDNVGSVYFYRFDGSAWLQTQKTFAPDAQPGDLFGKGVSMSGGVLVTGANRQDQNGFDAGAAYVMRFDGSTWVHEQKLLAPDGQPMDRFGTHVAVDGDLIVVGARLDDHLGSVDAGSAYIFRRFSAAWVPSGKLVGADTAAGDWLGHTVATDGTTVLVSARLHGHPGIVASGTTYAYAFPLHDPAGGFQPAAGSSLMLIGPGVPPVPVLVGRGEDGRRRTPPDLSPATSRRASGTRPPP